MDLKRLAQAVDAETARAFVGAARNVIDAMLIEGERVQQGQTPEGRDYNTASLPNDTPAGGWLSHDELRRTTQKMAEAIAAQKWTDGLVAAFRLLAMFGTV